MYSLRWPFDCTVLFALIKEFYMKVAFAKYHGLSKYILNVILIVTKFIVVPILLTFFRKMLMIHTHTIGS